MRLSPAERLALGLDDPPPGAADEFEHGPPNGGVLMPHDAPYTPNPRLALQLKEGERVTGPKIRGLVNELLAGNVEQANQALQRLFAVNPKEALKVYLELAEFSLPKLKAVAVQVDDRSESPKAMSFQQLQQMLTQQ